MEDAYVPVRSKIYLCYTCDDRPYKIKSVGIVTPAATYGCFTGSSHDSRYSTTESSAGSRLNEETRLPGGKGEFELELVQRQNVKVEPVAVAVDPC